jgi:hypothetical protein
VLSPMTTRYDLLRLPSGRLQKIKWERIVPFFRTIPQQTQQDVMRSLNDLLSDVWAFLNARGVGKVTGNHEDYPDAILSGPLGYQICMDKEYTFIERKCLKEELTAERMHPFVRGEV